MMLRFSQSIQINYTKPKWMRSPLSLFFSLCFLTLRDQFLDHSIVQALVSISIAYD